MNALEYIKKHGLVLEQKEPIKMTWPEGKINSMPRTIILDKEGIKINNYNNEKLPANTETYYWEGE